MLTSLMLPVFRELAGAEHVLLAGAGGGFDFFSALPFYFCIAGCGEEGVAGEFDVFKAFAGSVGATRCRGHVLR